MNAVKMTKGKKICPECGVLFDKGDKIFKSEHYHPSVEGCPLCSSEERMVLLKDHYEPLGSLFNNKNKGKSFMNKIKPIKSPPKINKNSNVELYFKGILANIISFIGFIMVLISIFLFLFSKGFGATILIIGIITLIYGKAKRFDFERQSGHIIYGRK